jgi:predicted DNA-binding transcriptional regulator AlpA
MMNTTATQPAVPPDYIQLSEFLARFSLKYSTYRRLRLKGKTPPEVKLTSKVILLKREDVDKWQSNLSASRKRKSPSQ